MTILKNIGDHLNRLLSRPLFIFFESILPLMLLLFSGISLIIKILLECTNLKLFEMKQTLSAAICMNYEKLYC